MTIRCVIVDDHELARARLADLLGAVADFVCVGQAADGHQALELIGREHPDLAFLDIQMPGMSGLDVLRAAEPRPLAIFTTAFDHHAVQAFELHAFDYLLKPFGRERLTEALERVRIRLRQQHSTAQLDSLADGLATQRPLERVFVRRRGAIVPVRLSAVERLEAQGDYVALCEAERVSLVRATLGGMLERLDPNRFVRVHRSHVINLDHVLRLKPYDDARLEVTLASGTRVVASRTRSPALRARLSL